ncbi:Outer membrane protein [Labilithrix luteola]|uniref:Outer membrane protein n=1 Tax=Labilithrix luteola TaxID=1391654 RepID=A0A0K1QFX3_9BACT|nr:OmpA family protein [Labilithrix luteola]AKV04664.1 Outer membrane protein [Labilithrix luteola]
MLSTRRPSRVLGVGLLAIVLTTSCATTPVLRGRIAGLNEVVAKAEQSGAKKCAPKELALAKSHLEFAATELDQGELSDAERHLALAEPNAQAALALSPRDKCSGAPAREGDRDGDGIADSLDRCPDARENYNGFEDLDGCPDDPDTDGDGIPDSRDACMLEPEDKDGYLDDDGCPEPDNDLDGIVDAKDKCPNQAEDPDGYQDDDGCPDDDNDNDTVADIYDECPNTPGQPSGPRPGCPNLVVVTAREIRITQQIQFDFNKATIKPVSYPILDAVRDVLTTNPKIMIEVQGHTDNVGQPAYNQKLSQQRADAVKAYLSSHGVDASRLVSKGYGMTQPLVPNNTEGNRALNRRVQFIRTENP